LIYSLSLTNRLQGPSWQWSHGSSIHNYLYNQCLSPTCRKSLTNFIT
jgi:hypothetical protein